MSLLPHGRWCRLLYFLLAASAVGAVHAQNATPEEEYKKLTRVSEDIQPLGEHPFGENISLYGGDLSFEQVDVSARGNGPLLQLVRQFTLEGHAADFDRAQYAFGDWELDLPRIETLTGHGWYYNAVTQQNHEVTGWEVNVGAEDPNARCTQFSRPPTMVMYLGDPALTPWEPSDWWKGYHLIIPGQGSQDLLSNVDAATKVLYPIVTKAHWRIGCVATTHNGMPGEGFLAQAPDGTTYRFDELVYRDTQDLSRPLYTTPSSPSSPSGSSDATGDVPDASDTSTQAPAASSADIMPRQRGMMLVTQITDRFGNTVAFSYDGSGHLTSMSASDGRVLTIQYRTDAPQLIHSVTLQPSSGTPRTWVYSYSTVSPSLTTLSGVTLPDGSAWSYGLSAFDTVSLSTAGSFSSCITLATPNLTSVTGTITHPSGLQGSFTVAAMKHGRSLVPRGCRNMQYNNEDTAGSYAEIPDAWYSYTLTQETLSGAGMSPRTWTYQYSPANDSWSDCAGCPTTVYTDVIHPDGSTVRHTFSNRYDYTESQLLRIDHYAGAAGASTLLRSETNGYAPPDTAPLPVRAGGNPQTNVNWDQTTKYSPLNLHVLTQEGDTYTWQAEAFNSYVQVIQVKRCNSFARPCDSSGEPVVEEQFDYLNDPGHWVFGLPTLTTNLTTGEVVDKNVYDSTDDTLTERWHFGQKLMSYDFDAQGQLASFTDGNGHTTTLGSYKRGIPQTIGYPDGKYQSLVVDDFGQIRSITDQAFATTAYAYDAVGRLTRIDYPTGDEQAWYPKTFSYAYVTGAERGVGANHWRRTVAQGSRRQVTYFDAMLQPVLVDTYIDGDAGSHSNVRSDYDYRGLTTFSAYPIAGTPSLGTITAGTTSTYDALGRLTQTQQTSELGTLTTTTAYLSGARKQVTDPKGHVTTTGYQVFDQPSYEAVIEVQAPAGVTQDITRDLYGNPTQIHQYGTYDGLSGDVTKTLVYDEHHRLCRTTEPESGSEVMVYDGGNNLLRSAAGLSLTGTGCGLEQVNPAGWTERTYDAMNRLTALTPPAGTQSTTYSYDPVGRLMSAISGISTWSATRNKRGQLTGETLQVTGQNPWHVGYAHDAYGSVRYLTYPNGEQIDYAPDALGRATRVGVDVSGIGYYANGAVAHYTLGNGDQYVTAQNARQLLSNFTYGYGGALTLSEDLSYDANGNLTQITDLAGGPRSQVFSYDALDRLTGATASAMWGSESYTYDPLNDIRSHTLNGQVSTYQYDLSHHLASISGANPATFGYDNRGNLNYRNGVSLSFDQKNQLSWISGSDSYSYDAFGHRVMKQAADGMANYYFYTQAGQLLYRDEPAVAKASNYLFLGRTSIARHTTIGTAAPKTIYSYVDPQNTPLRMVNAGRVTTVTLYHHPYGQPWGQAPNGPGYTGHVNDPETGLVYMQARYYDPAVGRFLSTDPVAPSAGGLYGFNRYAYANNNPIVNIDPDGRSPNHTSPPKDCGEEPCVDSPPPPPPPPTNLAPVAVTATTIALRPWQLDLLELSGRALPETIAAPNPWVVLVVGLVYPRPIADSTCSGTHACVMAMSGKFPPGYWPGDKGAVEWGRRHGIGAKEAKDKFHRGIKENTPGTRGDHDFGTNPDTGDVIDQSGDPVGNLNDE